MSKEDYVLVTAARNEEAYIERTIRSVIQQTELPKRWVIVSDGSTDGTDEIVRRYAKQYDFIQLISHRGQRQRNFSTKVNAINLGYQQLQNIEFGFFGNLDADVSFDTDYYERVLAKFRQNENLGIAGGVCQDFYKGRFRRVWCSCNSVAGPIQMFRRSCYEEIGGYLPLARGGIDAAAEVMARMRGWRVESFPELTVYHHRMTGTATVNILLTRFRQGIKDYLLGYHPLFQALRCVFRAWETPRLLGSLIWLCGYCWAALGRYEKTLPDHFVNYLRSEQMARLRSALFDKIHLKPLQ